MSRFLFLVLLVLGIASAAAEPLRVYIRSGPKTHGPGAHDHPAFLRDWTALLNERGAAAKGGDSFPTAAQLAETDVLILNAPDAGNIDGEDRSNLEAWLAKGGGVVAIHAGAVSRDHQWFKSVIGGSWKHGHTRWLEGDMSLYFTDRDNPITRECSNFDLDDEIYYDMDLLPDIQVLAAAYTPNPKEGRAADAPAHAGLKQVNVYDIQPQIWTYQAPTHRAFVMLPGHLYATFSHNSIRTILLRGIAWAAGRENPDELCKPEELGDALRYPANGPLRPELAVEKIEVHPEFEISLVAAEPLIQKAMNIDWDERGRMWVAETPEYPNGLRRSNVEAWKESGALKPGQYEREPADRISILTDSNGDGRMDGKKVFADKLELVTSFVLHKHGVIAAAAPDIWWLEDSDGDEVADKRTKLYTGLGTGDTHAVINNLRWGLDGWIYATHGYSGGKVTALNGPKDQPPVAIGSGVVRFLPDGTKFEQYSSKGGNTWGLDITWEGEVFWTQPTSGTVFFHTLLPESVLSKAKLPNATGWKGMISGQKTYPLMKWEQQAYRQIDQVGQYTAASGCAIYQGGAWPERWNQSYFTGEPTINIVSHYFTKPDGPSVTPHKESGREETEFIRSNDLWFRPIETRVGPDGALYVIDFYNQAVIHNDTRGPRHGPANAAVRPDRDHYFGRIWRVQHKQAGVLGPFNLDRDKTDSLIHTIKESPNGPRKHIAWRLLRESGALAKDPGLAESISSRQGGAVHRLYQNLSDPDTPAARKEIIGRFAAADDPWTRTALLAAASNAATDTVIDALLSPNAAALVPLVGELAALALRDGTPDDSKRMLIAASGAPAAAAPMQARVLDALAAAPDRAAPFDDQVAAAFVSLLENGETATTTLPILAAWDRDGKLASLAREKSLTLARTLADSASPVQTRIAAGRALIRLGDDTSLAAVTANLGDSSADPQLQVALIETLSAGNRAGALVPVFAKLADPLRPTAYHAILQRADASLALLKALEDGSIPPGLLGPGDLARLRGHPDKNVARAALGLLDSLVPGAKERAKIIAELTPEVAKPGGDPARGKVLFAAACATCHIYEDLGRIEVGPPLTGMGAHGPAELLVHIVDPNREVDPSFLQWNVTTRNGDIHAGVIAAENAQTLTLRNSGGDVTIRKSDIATRENTRRSFMPEGLHGLGAEGLRDILTFMTGTDSRHRVIDLREAYTADGRRGLFASEQAVRDTITPKRFGNVTFHDIPFFLMDPAKSRDGTSLIVLKGGRGNDFASSHPQRVEIPLGFAANRIHLLSGVAGWGYPATADKRVALKVTIHRNDGTAKAFDLANGVAFADYNRPVEVPGSKQLPDATSHGHLRLISLDLPPGAGLKSITLESLDNGISPVVAAITAETRNDP